MTKLKQIGLGLGILLFISILMYAGTLGIKSLGDQLVQDSQGAINPDERQKGLK